MLERSRFSIRIQCGARRAVSDRSRGTRRSNMRRRPWTIITLASIVAAHIHGTAWALDRVSGTLTRTFTIVDNTELVGDVICDVTAVPCFSFGVSDVEFRLNGFSITGKADPVTG